SHLAAAENGPGRRRPRRSDRPGAELQPFLPTPVVSGFGGNALERDAEGMPWADRARCARTGGGGGGRARVFSWALGGGARPPPAPPPPAVFPFALRHAARRADKLLRSVTPVRVSQPVRTPVRGPTAGRRQAPHRVRGTGGPMRNGIRGCVAALLAGAGL